MPQNPQALIMPTNPAAKPPLSLGTYAYTAGASVVSNVTGSTITPSSGTIAQCITTPWSGTYVTVNEVTGNPGFQLDFTFPIIGRPFNQVYIIGAYVGGTEHEVDVSILNNNSNQDLIGFIPTNTTTYVPAPYPAQLIAYTFDIIANPQSVYVSASGSVTVRLNHVSNGTVGHFFYCDYIALRNVA